MSGKEHTLRQPCLSNSVIQAASSSHISSSEPRPARKSAHHGRRRLPNPTRIQTNPTKGTTFDENWQLQFREQARTPVLESITETEKEQSAISPRGHIFEQSRRGPQDGPQDGVVDERIPATIRNRYHTFSAKDTTPRGSPQKNSPVPRFRSPLQRTFSDRSSASAVSSVTAVSRSSSGSNSTITPKSYHQSSPQKQKQPKIYTPVADSKLESTMGKKGRRGKNANRAPSAFAPTENALEPPKIPTQTQTMELSEDDTSDMESPQITPALPFSPIKTSYSSIRHDSWAHHGSFNSDSGISVGGSSPSTTSKQPSVEDTAETDEDENEEEDESSEEEGEEPEDGDEDDGGEEEEEEEEEDEEENEEESSDEGEEEESHEMEGENVNVIANKANQANLHRALTRTAPMIQPIMSRSSSGNSDHDHLQHMSQQEQDLRHYMYQNPPPQQQHYIHQSPMAQVAYPSYPPVAQPYPYTPPPAPQAPASPQHNLAYRQADMNKKTVTGYEMVASKLSHHARESNHHGASMSPIYRKFEALNHRLLLHLQDELSELEEELRSLDEYIAQIAPKDESGRSKPASRRLENRFGIEVHRRRTDLLGNIFLKMGQYNQALSSYRDATKGFEPADPDHVRNYRVWMEKNAPLDKAETRFLEHKHDLMSLKISRAAPTSPNNAGTESHAAFVLPLLLLLPLLTFPVVTAFLGRILILATIGYTAAAVISSTNYFQLMSLRQWAICAAVYFTAMTAAACAI